ncbi:conjugal transfer protein TraO (plasmid) [Xylella fastidiosa subsp. fastidiosa]|uniref:TraO n=3 Tax=Xylella fastidiosa TaxID=2371 RepID=L7SUJ4_XYLFS|nr:KfrB domain-containing protein [Xylella fastidiosa]ACB93648.1 putative conjugation protein TraO [Xylella fastidiosa M23]AGC23510.1 traO [Xylella fastidiosa subsp. multiplex]MBE0263007.1 conjugal transfer protein TraO [Xylella fastidiosa subsp. fastidiosa]MBE0265320.1 conjugal transfer protein TraO [Xylella fastidiosa subsp. fastidiosa]MBE0267436.1 conjugal transfer protein TraO [Xylella fastidiosa subsp. fastidiosa]
MKHRVLVMNGQKIVQNEQTPGKWHTEHVDKAGLLKPGIYNIYAATVADKAKEHEGTIVHVDKQAIYQQIGKQFVKHECIDFYKIPEIGGVKRIAYDQSTGHAQVDVASEKLGKKRSR